MGSDVASELARLRDHLDAEHAPLTASESASLRARIDARLSSRRRSRWVATAALAGAAAAAAAVIWLAGSPDTPWYEAQRNPDCLSSPDGTSVHAGACESAAIAIGDDRVELERGATVAREDDGIEVVGGAATFEVAHRTGARRPFRVYVSGGTIAVLGTRFRVVQRERGGEVSLERGRIVFEASDGRRIELAPGERLSWPLAPPRSTAGSAAPAEASDEAAAPRAAPATDEPTMPPHRARRAARSAAEPGPAGPDIDAVMRRMFQLRSQHRYREAASLLREQAGRDDFTRAQRARLSFELAVLLDEQLSDHAAACRAYRLHAQRFPDDSLRHAQLGRALATCP